MSWEKNSKSEGKIWHVISTEFKRLGWLHIMIWVGYSLVFFYGPNLIFDTETAILMTLRTLAVNALIFYINVLVLLPLLVGRSKFKAYAVAILILLGSVSLLWEVTDPVSQQDWEKLRRSQPEVLHFSQGENPGGEQLSPRPPQPGRPGPEVDEKPPKPPWDLFGRHTMFSIFSSLGILFLSTMFWLMVDARRKENERLSLTNENLSTEMKFLKSQMNPHFLFNALNNIYSLAQRQSEKTALLVLKLSSMLRFIVYETDNGKIPLQNEVDYIRNFVEFQKIKLEEEPRLEINLEDVRPGVKIEPMLLFPFVENAFKHSNIDDTVNGWIQMKLEYDGQTIRFSCANSKPPRDISKDKVGGIGIDNVKKRLSYLYRDCHHIEIKDEADRFEVLLEINLS
jgi:hypothetical protein